MTQDRSVTDIGSDEERPTREEHIAVARSVVYDANGELIDEDDLEGALEAHGVDVGVSEDGLPEYRDVPRDLSLSAVHLAVDLRKDPAKFITDPIEA